VSCLEVALFSGPVTHAPGETVLALLPEDERPLGGDAGRIDWRLCGGLSGKLASGYIQGSIGEALLIPATRPLRNSRIMMLGVGPVRSLRDGSGQGIDAAMSEAMRRLAALGCRSALLALPRSIVLEQVATALVRAAVRALVRARQRSFRIIVPNATGHESALQEAVAALLPEASRAGLELELGRVIRADPYAARGQGGAEAALPSRV